MFRYIFLLGLACLLQELQAQNFPNQLIAKAHSIGFSIPASKITTSNLVASGACLPDSIVKYNEVTLAPDSFAIVKTVFTYDAQGNQLTVLTIQRDVPSQPWRFANGDSSAYNAQNVLVLQASQAANGNGDIDKYLTQFYPTGTSVTKLDSTVSYSDPFASGTLIRNSKTNIQYLPNDLIGVKSSYAYDPTIGWIDFQKDTYSYNTKNQIIGLLNEVWDGNAWYENTLEGYTYLPNDSIGQITISDQTTNQPVSRMTFAYDLATNTSTAIGEGWGPGWFPVFNLTLDFDAQGVLEFMEYFFDVPGFLTFGKQEYYHYLANSNCLQSIDHWSSADGIDYIKDGVDYYFYSGGSTSTNTLSKTKLLDYYPNPSCGQSLTIESEIGTRIEIFNVFGSKVIFTTCEDSQVTLPLSSLVPGIYYLKATHPFGQTSVGKLIRN
jgi:hypothetical protein